MRYLHLSVGLVGATRNSHNPQEGNPILSPSFRPACLIIFPSLPPSLPPDRSIFLLGFGCVSGASCCRMRLWFVADNEKKLHLHELQGTLRQNRSRFDSKTRRRLEEDLADLAATGRPTVLQQTAVVRRLQRSYPFLRADGLGGHGGRRRKGGGGGTGLRE